MEKRIALWYDEYVKRVRNCKECSVRDECREPVPGIGNVSAKIVFVGRNPGGDEDKAGKPFVGRAGKVLNRFLDEVGLKREDCFITNLVLCHSRNNRLLSSEEIGTCVRKHLIPSLKKISPRIVVGFGSQTNYFLAKVSSVASKHAMWGRHEGLNCIYVVSMHPASVCFNPSNWEQFLKLKFVLQDLLGERNGSERNFMSD